MDLERLKTNFVNIVDFICMKMSLEKDRIIIDIDYEKNDYLTARYDNEFNGFSLYLYFFKENMTVDFSIYSEKTPRHHEYSLGKTEIFSLRWIEKCLADIETKKKSLDYYMTELKYFKIEDESRAEYSFERDLMGLCSKEPKTIHIMKAMHIRDGDNYRAFSYGIYDFLNKEWIIYPYCSGLDSGGAFGSEKRIRKLIDKAKKYSRINLIEIYMKRKEFYEYFEIDKGDLIIDFRDLTYLSNFKEKGEHIFNLIHSKKLVDALSEMRRVIDEQLNTIIKINKLEEKDKLKDKYYLLVTKKILSKDYISYLDSFLRLGNAAHHRTEETFWTQFPDVENKPYFLANGLSLGITMIRYLDAKVRDGGEADKRLVDLIKD